MTNILNNIVSLMTAYSVYVEGFCILGALIAIFLKLPRLAYLILPAGYMIVRDLFLKGFVSKHPVLAITIGYLLFLLVLFLWGRNVYRWFRGIMAEAQLEQIQAEMAVEELIKKQGYYKPEV